MAIKNDAGTMSNILKQLEKQKFSKFSIKNQFPGSENSSSIISWDDSKHFPYLS